MAKIEDKKEKKAKDSAKNKRGPITFLRELKSELKRVIWPDKTKMKQSITVVLAIVTAAVLIIFVTDNIINGGLNLAGFYKVVEKQTATTTSVSETTATTAATTTEAAKTTETTKS